MPITVFGSLNLDLVTAVPHLPRPGETVLGTSTVRRTGGKGANQAVASSRAGAEVRMVGTCGADDTGELFLRTLAEEAIDTASVRTSEDHPTGTAMIMVDARGENLIALSPGANASVTDVQADDACADLTRDDLLLLQLELPLAAVSRAARVARGRSATVVLNAAPAVPGVADILPHVDVLVINEQELIEVSRECGAVEGGVDSRAAHLARHCDCLVVTTLGREGALVTNRTSSTRFPAPTVDVVDSTGAGDTFTGYLAAGMSRGEGITEAVLAAVEAASIMVTRHGTQDAIPRRHDIGSEEEKGA